MPYKNKEDQKAYYKKWYAENRIKEIKNAVERNKRNRKKASDFIVDYKKNKGCTYCPEEESCCLDFHHMDQDEKEITIAQAPYEYGWGIDRIKEEIKKCIVVCSNCHRKLHAGLLKIK
jgi:hypothetical protein